MIMLATVLPIVTALTVPSLRGCSSARSVRPARLVQMAAAPLQDSEPRTIEVCEVNEEGRISECQVLELDELDSEFGSSRLSSDPEAADELFFEMTTTDNERERVQLTLDDWQKQKLTESGEVLPEVTEDALQKALGPESVSADESRLHLHFGAGRLGLGLVLPAVSASGVPFAAVQRPKARWMAIFKEGSRQQQGARAERRYYTSTYCTLLPLTLVYGIYPLLSCDVPCRKVTCSELVHVVCMCAKIRKAYRRPSLCVESNLHTG